MFEFVEKTQCPFSLPPRKKIGGGGDGGEDSSFKESVL